MQKRWFNIIMTELNIVSSSFKLLYVIFILSMANRGGEEDWNKKRQQAQPYINRIWSLMEKKMQCFEQVGFLTRCRKEKLMPKGLRVRLPSSIEKSEYGQRLKGRSENKVIKRAVSDLFVKILKACGNGYCEVKSMFDARVKNAGRMDEKNGKLGFELAEIRKSKDS